MMRKKNFENEKLLRTRHCTLPTDRSMMRSDALPTNIRVIFKVSYALQKSSLETYAIFHRTKRIPSEETRSTKACYFYLEVRVYFYFIRNCALLHYLNLTS